MLLSSRWLGPLRQQPLGSPPAHYWAPGQEGLHLVPPTATGPTPLLKGAAAGLASRRTALLLGSPAPAERQAAGPRALRHVTDTLGWA
ncbi:hypothetical protein NDU88_000574 [Pleurodeles waltl]|uniref:Uncharacterized protein n=1 Tax=Pleurodeles waltl TaxID=8319 RepID=A0AAV7VWI6_PLEWA|nr:hypothetical protein NDU88_000574 [Pleurodeles waltl]